MISVAGALAQRCPAYPAVANLSNPLVRSFDIDLYAGVWVEVASVRIGHLEDEMACTQYAPSHPAAGPVWFDSIAFRQGGADGPWVRTPRFEAKTSPNATLPGMLSEGCLGPKMPGHCHHQQLEFQYWILDLVAGGGGGYQYALVYSCVEAPRRDDFAYLFARPSAGRSMPRSVRARFEEHLSGVGVNVSLLQDTRQAGCSQ